MMFKLSDNEKYDIVPLLRCVSIELKAYASHNKYQKSGSEKNAAPG